MDDTDQIAFEMGLERFRSLKGLAPLNFEVEIGDAENDLMLVVYSSLDGELILGKSYELTTNMFLRNDWSALLPALTQAMDTWFAHYAQTCRDEELRRDSKILIENRKRIMFDIGCLLLHTYGIKSPSALSLYSLGSDVDAATMTG